MSVERNKFLTEAMGYVFNFPLNGYYHPDKPAIEYMINKEGINFSTWEGFGKLWEWAQKQEWYLIFKSQWWGMLDSHLEFTPDSLIHPDRFADAIYEYLKEGNK